jgi:hypothetical protein
MEFGGSEDAARLYEASQYRCTATTLATVSDRSHFCILDHPSRGFPKLVAREYVKDPRMEDRLKTRKSWMNDAMNSCAKRERSSYNPRTEWFPSAPGPSSSAGRTQSDGPGRCRRRSNQAVRRMSCMPCLHHWRKQDGIAEDERQQLWRCGEKPGPLALCQLLCLTG